MVKGFYPRGMHFPGLGEECNENQMGFLKMKVKRIRSDTENQKMEMEKVLKKVNTI